MKQCTKCGLEKPLDEFYRDPRLKKDGRKNSCRRCDCARSRERHAENPEAHRAVQRNFRLRMKEIDPNYQRRFELLRKYKLSLEEFDGMLARQGGGCAVCGCREPGGQGSFHVDHDHACCPGQKSCGRCVRGLLCNNCNTVVVPALESGPLIMARGLAYLSQAA